MVYSHQTPNSVLWLPAIVLPFLLRLSEPLPQADAPGRKEEMKGAAGIFKLSRYEGKSEERQVMAIPSPARGVSQDDMRFPVPSLCHEVGHPHRLLPDKDDDSCPLHSGGLGG